MDIIVNRIIKISLTIGSFLFLAGAIVYLMEYDRVGLFVYLFCAIFFVFGSVLDLLYYEYIIKKNNVTKTKNKTIT